MRGIGEILKHSGSDKATGHSYDLVYGPLFEKIRRFTHSVLEIGVYRGASLRAWHEIFPAATIVGLDPSPQKDMQIPKERAVCLRVDATNKAAIAPAVAKYGPFDVIVDDGSHDPKHQKASLSLLLPHVRRGGFYIIEDVRNLEIALALAKPYKGVVIDLRAFKGKHDDILVVFCGR